MPETYRYTEQQNQPAVNQPSLVSLGNNELAGVQQLQTRWDKALHIPEKRSGSFANYNPVLARWNWERLQTPQRREVFRENELKNITTALRERHHTKESSVTLFVDEDKKIRNDAFPDEPYEDMLERGRAYREEHGSQDTTREKAEIEGFKKIQHVLTDKNTPVGSTFVVISPPSLIEDTPYTHNFVDMYSVAEDRETGQRKFDYVRYASPLDYDQYGQLATRLQPDFMEQKAEAERETCETLSMDAWFLANPLFMPGDGKSSDELFSEYFADDIKAMEEDAWQKLDSIYLPYKLYLLDQITKSDFDPIKIAEAYNALLVSTKKEHLPKQETVHVIFDAAKTKLESEEYQRIAAFVNRHGRDRVEEVRAGCGNSGGFSLSIPPEKAPFLFNSVAQFSNKEWFKCPECRYNANGPIGNTCPGCGLTKEEYAEESGAEMCD
jgi:hypothetical protein